MKAAVEQSLSGQNESARVAAVRLLSDLEPFRAGCPECEARKVEGPAIEENLLALLARHEPERKRELRAVVHEELAPLAEHVDVAQVEEQLVARL